MQLSKRLLSASLLALAATAPLAARADLGVGLSITLAQPGVYGRIDLGGAPPPPVVYARPLQVQPLQDSVPPVYLYVPPEHQRHWRKYCREYHACGVPVFFVREDWYHREYEPRFAGRGDGDHRDARREDRADGRRDEDRRRDDRHEDGRRMEDRRDDGRRGDERHGEERR